MKVALWAQNLAYPVSSIEDWGHLVGAQAIKARAEGAEILLMPEYSAAHWLAFIPREIQGPAQMAKVASYAATATAMISDIAKKHSLLIISGSFPVPRPELKPLPFSNRAHIHFPNGKLLFQDKLCLIPDEKPPSDWALSPGSKLTVFEYGGYRMAVIICLDIELPALSAKISGLNLDLILVPSMTAKLAGYHRVTSCAKARAVELLAAIANVGAIAGAEGRDQFIAGASFFVPCEEQFGHTGILAEIPPTYKTEGTGPLLVKSLPLEAIRKLRHHGAEVWPGAWDAGHVVIEG